MQVTTVSKGDVEKFWDANPCGYKKSDNPLDRTFFEEATAKRYADQWHIPELVRFERFRGKKVLEIGCGMGIDGSQFARHGALYTGVDLTSAALNLSTRHFKAKQLDGDFLKADAENLPFPGEHFDCVYSHGVLHHTPNIQKALAEIHRVLIPGGDLILMLYNKHSYDYYVTYLLYYRGLAMLLYPDFMFNLAKRLTGRQMRQFAKHRENLKTFGPGYLKPSVFVHHIPDGVDCPLANVYTKAEVKKLLESSNFTCTEIMASYLQNCDLVFSIAAVLKGVYRGGPAFSCIYSQKK
jgi:ubiquinone/menaquinone biosynthesis C-methylase UbiE